MLRRIKSAARMINWRTFSLKFGFCPLCACRRLLIRLDAHEIGIRCTHCQASAVTMSMVSVLRHKVPNLQSMSVYEISARGPLFRFLLKNAKQLTCSEYLDDVPPGQTKNGIQCQDVQKLTFPDCSFDVCTSTEVFEHVPDDARGFSEIHRVLKPGGVFVLTVPLSNIDTTIERARLLPDGKIEHRLPPEYHGDPIRSHKPILAFRNYGKDIVNRMIASGFENAEIVLPPDRIPWGYARPVIVARRSL